MPGLKDAGVELDTPVSKSVNGLSLQSARKLMLDDLGLKYVIHNEALMITSPAKAESDEFMTTKAYPVTDLVLSGSDGTVDFQPLSDLLQNTVATKSWLDNGGNGTMSDMLVGNRAIIVLSQTQEVHEQIEQTLEMLRKAGGLKSGARKLVEQEQSEDETDLPARPRLHRLRPRRWARALAAVWEAAWAEWEAAWAVVCLARAKRHSPSPSSLAEIPICWADCGLTTRPTSSPRSSSSSSARRGTKHRCGRHGRRLFLSGNVRQAGLRKRRPSRNNC